MSPLRAFKLPQHQPRAGPGGSRLLPDLRQVSHRGGPCAGSLPLLYPAGDPSEHLFFMPSLLEHRANFPLSSRRHYSSSFSIYSPPFLLQPPCIESQKILLVKSRRVRSNFFPGDTQSPPPQYLPTPIRLGHSRHFREPVKREGLQKESCGHDGREGASGDAKNTGGKILLDKGARTEGEEHRCRGPASLHFPSKGPLSTRGTFSSLAFRKISVCGIYMKRCSLVCSQRKEGMCKQQCMPFSPRRLIMHWLGESVRSRLPDIHCAYGFKLAYPLKRTVGNIYLGALLLRMRHLGDPRLGSLCTDV